VPSQGLTVAVTGPTGDLGIAVVDRLERSRAVKKIVGMARRPFDPKEQGWTKTEYRQGDVQDSGSVTDTLKGADVVVHLAFSLMGEGDRTRAINVDGSRTVFEAAAKGGAHRICYASSVAAYGFHADNPLWLTEDVPPRGTPEHFYSAQKAEVESVLAELLLRHQRTTAYVFRPCIVAGPESLLLIENLPYVQISGRLPGAVRRLFDVMPVLKPVLPDPGVPFQLVHADDVATAFRAAVTGRGKPGVYNLAGPGTLTMSDMAEELGWYSVPLPELAIDATAEVVGRLPFMPAEAAWVNAFRVPVLMDTAKARKELGWRPKHNARNTLRSMIAAARAERLIGA
jgi:nucleoside-diphosphate-sugar epimerase